MPITEVASRFEVHRQTVHRWLARYERGGIGALADRSHRPRECPHQMLPEVEAQILEWRRRHPGWGPRRLVHEAARVGLVTSRSAVYRCLVRHQLIEEHPRRRRAEKWKRWERARPMELWQLDLVGGICLDDGTELKALTGVDDHSRFCVSARLMRRATARPVCEAFAAAMRAHGVPEEVLTDNGRQFTGRFATTDVEVLFDRICRENGITHRLTAPYSPTTTGKIERFHRALRTEFLRGRIGMATPAERFRGNTGPAPEVPAPRGSDDRAGDDWVSRRVAANGVISVAYQQISVGKHRAGVIVDVHLDGQLLQVWHRDELLKTIIRTDTKEVRKRRASQAR